VRLFCVNHWQQCLVPSVLRRCWLGGRKCIWPVKTEWWSAGMIICLQQGADLHTAQLMPLPLTASCFSNIQMSLPFWYRLTWVVPDKGLLNGCMYWQQCMVNKHEHICRSLLRQSSNAHRDSVSEHRHKRRLAPSPDREQFVCLYLAVYASRSVCQCLAVFFYCLVLCIYCLCPSYR